MLGNFVTQEDIPLIISLAISRSLHRDTYYWSFTKSGMYTVKFGYWVAKKLLKLEDDVVFTEPSITKCQAFA